MTFFAFANYNHTCLTYLSQLEKHSKRDLCADHETTSFTEWDRDIILDSETGNRQSCEKVQSSLYPFCICCCTNDHIVTFLFAHLICTIFFTVKQEEFVYFYKVKETQINEKLCKGMSIHPFCVTEVNCVSKELLQRSFYILCCLQ